jgi:hypothetical protein
MSQELKSVTKQMVVAATDEFLKLLVTVPSGKFTWQPEPTTKSAQQIGWHVALTLHNMARILKSEKVQMVDFENESFKTQHATPDRLKSFIELQLKELFAATDQLKSFEEAFAMPWGDTWPAKTILFRGCLEHTAYHGGQLAYIQTLLGDTQDHF